MIARNHRLEVEQNILHSLILEEGRHVGLPELEFGHGFDPDSTGEVGASS